MHRCRNNRLLRILILLCYWKNMMTFWKKNCPMNLVEDPFKMDALPLTHWFSDIVGRTEIYPDSKWPLSSRWLICWQNYSFLPWVFSNRLSLFVTFLMKLLLLFLKYPFPAPAIFFLLVKWPGSTRIKNQQNTSSTLLGSEEHSEKEVSLRFGMLNGGRLSNGTS